MLLLFLKYAPFGITYEEGDGLGNVYYNGRLVSRFADLTPDGGALTFSSENGGGIPEKTVYDESGRLTEIKTVTAQQTQQAVLTEPPAVIKKALLT